MKTVTWMGIDKWDEVLAEVLRQAGGEEEEVIVLRDGHPFVLITIPSDDSDLAVAITPIDDDDLAWCARERDPAFLESLVRAKQQVQNGQTVSHEQLKKDLQLD